ncbi:sensor histidine kinase [Nonomuraea zeae]|uniref:sensor histidine kinase n=1 Tax=Nonomuraea zeae TaxID=1642303 RepID=UPI001F107E2B|nr:histidine kinase [Nonomuraea zeae]
MRVLGWRAEVAAEAGLGAGFAAALAFQAYRLAASWGGGFWVFGCAAGAVVCSIALARRLDRLRAVVAGLGVAAVAVVVAWLAGLPGEPSPAMSLGVSVLVGSAVRTLPVRPACAVAAGGLAVAAGGLTAASSPVLAVLSGLCWLAAVAAGLGPRLLSARRRALTDRVRRNERLALARELHDVVAHHVTCVVLQAQAARIQARRHPEQVAGSLAGIEAAGSDALSATRQVVGLLRDAGPVRRPLRGPDAPRAALGAAVPGPALLRELVDRFTGPPVRLRLPDGEPAWPQEVAGTVYRVVQESLTNVSRHAAHARSVTVGVTRDRGTLTVEVVDDAPPAAGRSPGTGGYGLVGMRERVEGLGGSLRTGPRPEGGWSVLATVPLPGGRRW